MAEDTEKQPKKQLDYLKEYQWQKGQSGNPKGRPKGKTLKEFTREFLENMSEEARFDFLKSVGAETVWKMAEGNPSNEITGKDGKDLIPEPTESIKKLAQKLVDEQRKG